MLSSNVSADSPKNLPAIVNPFVRQGRWHSMARSPPDKNCAIRSGQAGYELFLNVEGLGQRKHFMFSLE
jgi:hypothetical protein